MHNFALASFLKGYRPVSSVNIRLEARNGIFHSDAVQNFSILLRWLPNFLDCNDNLIKEQFLRGLIPHRLAYIFAQFLLVPSEAFALTRISSHAQFQHRLICNEPGDLRMLLLLQAHQ